MSHGVPQIVGEMGKNQQTNKKGETSEEEEERRRRACGTLETKGRKWFSEESMINCVKCTEKSSKIRYWNGKLDSTTWRHEQFERVNYQSSLGRVAEAKAFWSRLKRTEELKTSFFSGFVTRKAEKWGSIWRGKRREKKDPFLFFVLWWKKKHHVCRLMIVSQQRGVK